MKLRAWTRAVCRRASVSASCALLLNFLVVATWLIAGLCLLLRLADSGPVRHPGKNLRDMPRLDGRTVTLELPSHVQKTTEVAGEHSAYFRLVDVGGLACNDSVRKLAVFRRKQTAETAAGLRLLEFDERESFDACKQTPGLSPDAELSQSCAGIMVGDSSIEARLHGLDLHDVDEKAHELVRLLREAFGLERHVRLAREQARVMRREHAATRPARNDDVVAIGECLDSLARQRLRRRAVAGVIGGLPATGLRRHDDRATCILEQLDRGEADRRADDVDEAGDEQSDARPML